MVVYKSAYEFLQSATTVIDKIKKLDALIDVLYETATKSATMENISEYSLDDGQVKIHNIYKGTDAVLKAIQGFEKLRDMYVVRYNKLHSGSVIRLVDGKNLTRNNQYGRF